MSKKIRKGGDLFTTGLKLGNLGLWGVAAQNSDGTVAGTIGLRLWYGLIILALIATPIVLFFLFAKKTPMPTTARSGVNKKKTS
jgi:hypothetical protein